MQTPWNLRLRYRTFGEEESEAAVKIASLPHPQRKRNGMNGESKHTEIKA